MHQHPFCEHGRYRLMLAAMIADNRKSVESRREDASVGSRTRSHFFPSATQRVQLNRGKMSTTMRVRRYRAGTETSFIGSRIASGWTEWARTPNHDAFLGVSSVIACVIGNGTGDALAVRCGEGRVSRVLKECG